MTYRQLDYWPRSNLIRPSIADACRSGSQRRDSYRDLVELKVVQSLLDAGVSQQSARRAVQYLRNNLGEGIVSTKLVLNRPESVIVRCDGELIELMKLTLVKFCVSV